MSEYEGGWIITFTGKKFHFLDPQPEEICIEDIAHHLSMLCRFTGACSVFYSVADHSVRVSRAVPPEYALAGLLHDAAEAYLNDISRPVKYSHKLDETEHLISTAIAKKFNVELDLPIVKIADSKLLATEARDLGLSMVDWEVLPEPLESKIRPVTSRIGEIAFLYRYRTLTGGVE